MNQQSHTVIPQVHSLIDRIIEEESEEYLHLEESMRTACMLKNREIIYEALSEYQRKGNFVRIYPSRQSNIYDQFFQGNRPLNKLLHKVLFSDRILKQGFHAIPKSLTNSNCTSNTHLNHEDSKSHLIQAKNRRLPINNHHHKDQHNRSQLSTNDNTNV